MVLLGVICGGGVGGLGNTKKAFRFKERPNKRECDEGNSRKNKIQPSGKRGSGRKGG